MNFPHLYDYLCRARARVLDAARPLTDAQRAQAFPIGPGSLERILTHVYISEWYYVERILDRDVPPYEQWEIRDDNPPPFAELERRWAEQAQRTRAALAGITDLNAPRRYTVTSDDGRTWRVNTTIADIATQLILHETYHRAQAMNVLRHLGVTITDDLDYNTLTYDRTEIV